MAGLYSILGDIRFSVVTSNKDIRKKKKLVCFKATYGTSWENIKMSRVALYV